MHSSKIPKYEGRGRGIYTETGLEDEDAINTKMHKTYIPGFLLP